MSDWEHFQKSTQRVSAVVALVLNSLVIHLVIHKSPKNLGAYKNLIISTAIFEMVLALTDVVVQPIFHSFGSTFVIIVNVKDSYLNYETLKFLFSFYAGLFGSLISLFSIQFIYRYWVVSGNKNYESFQGYKLFLWLLIPAAIGSHWALAAHFPCSPRNASDEYLKNNIMEEFGLDIKQNLYIAPYFYEKQKNGSVNIYYPSFLAIIGDFLTIGASQSVAIFFGVKCYRTLKKFSSVTTSSKRYTLLQNQLFYSLVTQTLIPVILMHIPVSAMFIFAFLEINIGSLNGIVTVSIAIFPAIDPFPTIFIVKNYRNALRSYFASFLSVIVKKMEPSESSRADIQVHTV